MLRWITGLFRKSQSTSNAKLVTGELRPSNIPPNWIGKALPEDQGWYWMNPDNRGDCVRIYAAEEPFVIVTEDGWLIGEDGQRTGERLEDWK
jgi:hypothetical protein